MSKRYFISNLDTKFGQALLDQLNKQASDDPIHLCTMRTPNQPKPKGIKKILKPEKPKLSRKKMLEDCDVYIYNVEQTDLKDIDFGLSIFNKPVEGEKVFILVSNIMTWSQSERKVKPEKKPEPELNEDGTVKEEGKEEGGKEDPVVEDGKEVGGDGSGKDDSSQPSGSEENQDGQKQPSEQPPKPIQYTFYDDKDFSHPSRHSLQQYTPLRQIQDKVLSFKCQNVKFYVICSGITYGQGESVFYQLFKSAWLQQPRKLPYLGEGTNIIPTIHIADLAKFAIKVANAPPEENPYLLAFDDARDRTQKAIIESISRGVGSGEVESVEHSGIIQNQEIFRLDIDIRPSKLLVGTVEEPVEFDWTCKLGIQQSSKKVLQQFCQTHRLRPLNLLIVTSQAFRSADTSTYNLILTNLQKQYRTPILRIQDLLLQAKRDLTDDLKQDLEQQYLAILSYLNEEKARPLDETLKVLYRVVRWRLERNDCACRGYILENYPRFQEEIRNIFVPVSQSKLKRKVKKIKPKPMVQEVAPETVVKSVEDEDGKPVDPDAPPVEDGKPEQKAPEAEPEPEPEPQPQPQPEQQGDKPKKQKFYPQSIIKFHKLQNQKHQYINQVVTYFSQAGIEQLVYDTTDRNPTVIFQSLRSYIQRNGRPNNYLIAEQSLLEQHKTYYCSLNQTSIDKKQQSAKQQQQKLTGAREAREKVAREVWDMIKGEGEQEIKKMPFRNYLMEFVVPILNEGLLEVSNIIPNDPVELLAEYLFMKSYDV